MSSGNDETTRSTRLIGFFWGFCEATLFVLVPDIWLSRAVILKPRDGYFQILIVLVDALAGGALMYLAGVHGFSVLRTVLSHVPAVSETMIEAVGEQLNAGFVVSRLTSPARAQLSILKR